MRLTFSNLPSSSGLTVSGIYGSGRKQKEFQEEIAVQPNLAEGCRPEDWDVDEVMEDLASDQDQESVICEGSMEIEDGDAFDIQPDEYIPDHVMQAFLKKSMHATGHTELKNQSSAFPKSTISGLTKYPLSSASVRKNTNYQMTMLSTQLETVFSQYEDTKIGLIDDAEMDVANQVVISNPDYEKDNIKNFRDIVDEVKNPHVDLTNEGAEAAIINFDNSEQNHDESAKEIDENSETDYECDFEPLELKLDAQSVHSLYSHKVFAPKVIDIIKPSRTNKMKQPGKVSKSKNTEEEIQNVKIDPILYKKPTNKSENKERIKLLKEMKKERRRVKKNVKDKFKISELNLKQNTYGVNQSMKSLRF